MKLLGTHAKRQQRSAKPEQVNVYHSLNIAIIPYIPSLKAIIITELEKGFITSRRAIL